VHAWWQAHPKSDKSSNNLEIGQSVVLESWVDEASGMARVRYRGSTWDARVEGPARLNDVLYINDQQKGVLFISATRP
jgi:membrane protein implicated in regulation of membrane protease activity